MDGHDGILIGLHLGTKICISCDFRVCKIFFCLFVRPLKKKRSELALRQSKNVFQQSVSKNLLEGNVKMCLVSQISHNFYIEIEREGIEENHRFVVLNS